jgi:Enoyl-CoA hydratase/isomerase
VDLGIEVKVLCSQLGDCRRMPGGVMERLNAFGNQSTYDLSTAAEALAQDNATHIVIITGAGRAFSTGIDLQELSAGEIDMTYHHRWEGALRTFETMPKVGDQRYQRLLPRRWPAARAGL